jgi:hypothetical protein
MRRLDVSTIAPGQEPGNAAGGRRGGRAPRPSASAPAGRRRGKQGTTPSLVAAAMAGVLLLAVAAAALGGRSAPVRAQGAPPAPLSTAAVAPADAVFYAALTLDTTSRQWTAAEALLRRAGLGDLLDRLVRGVLADAAQATTGADDLTSFLGGELALVVTGLDFADDLAGMDPGDLGLATPSPGEPAPAGAALVLRAADPDAAFATAQDLLARAAFGSGTAVRETRHRGVTISTVAPAGAESGTALARLDDFLTLAETAADLAPIIDAHAGHTASLAEADDFRTVRRELANDFLIFGFANGAAVAPQLAASFAADTGIPADEVFATLAVSAGFTVWADDPGVRVDTVTLPAAAPAATPGPATFEPTLDERVPADTMLFVSGSDLGRSRLLEVLALVVSVGLAESIAPPAGGDAASAGEEGDPHEAAVRFLTFNLRDDFLRQLVGEFGLALSATSLDLDGLDGVVVSGVADEARLNDALSKLAFLLNLVLQGEGLDGGVRIEATAGALTHRVTAVLPDFGGLVRAGFGVVGGQLLVGYGRGFDDFVAGPNRSLATNPRYQAALAALPADHNAVIYVDLGRVIPLAQPRLERLIADALPGEVEPGTPTAAQLAADLDLSALQAFAAVGFERDGLRHGRAILTIAER